MIRVGCISTNNARTFIWSFCWLVTRNYYFVCWLNSKTLSCVALSLSLCSIVARIFNVFIDIGLAPRPSYNLFLLAIIFGAAFLICRWSLAHSSVVRLEGLDAYLSYLWLDVSYKFLLDFFLRFFTNYLLHLFT